MERTERRGSDPNFEEEISRMFLTLLQLGSNSTNGWSQTFNDPTSLIVSLVPVIVAFEVIFSVVRIMLGHSSSDGEDSSGDYSSEEEEQGEDYARTVSLSRMNEDLEDRYTCEYCKGFVHDIEGRCPICSAPRRKEDR